MGMRWVIMAAAVWVPIAVSCALGAYTALWRLESRLDEAASETLRRAEAVIGRVRGHLEAYLPAVDAPCGPALVGRFRSDLETLVSLRHLGLFSPDLIVRCSDAGGVRFPLVAGPVAAVSGQHGLMMALQEAVLDDYEAPVSILLLAVRGAAGSGAFAMLDARGLANDSAAAAVRDGRVITMRLSNGVAVVRVPPAPLAGEGEWFGLGPVQAVARSEETPLVVEAAAEGDGIARVVRQSLLLSLPVGVLFAVLAGMAFVRAPLADLRLRRRLRRALRSGEIEVHYQPIIRLADDRCVGAEALMRWHHPRAGMVEPDAFIPLVERGGCIIDLTRHVMRRVASDLPAMSAVFPDVRISINLAAVHLQASVLGDDVVRIFTESGLTRHIVFEATERQLITDEVSAEESIRHLHQAGIRVYLDDFGTGHSSLAYLQRFPVDGIKIPQRFVSDIGTDAPQRSVIDAIIHLGQGLDLAMIAEGVETEEQAVYLKDAAVGYGQGFYWAAPLGVSAFLEYLRRNGGPEDARQAQGHLNIRH